MLATVKPERVLPRQMLDVLIRAGPIAVLAVFRSGSFRIPPSAESVTSTTVLTNYPVFRPQHGHRSRRASSAAASSRRSVVMESGTWRCLRRGAPGPEAFG